MKKRPNMDSLVPDEPNLNQKNTHKNKNKNNTNRNYYKKSIHCKISWMNRNFIYFLYFIIFIISSLESVQSQLPSYLFQTVAGNGTASSKGDGLQATAAALNLANDVWVDSIGNIYFCEYLTYRVRKVSTNGIIITIAGNGSPSQIGFDGTAVSISLDGSYSVTGDTAGQYLYFSSGNYFIWRYQISNGYMIRFAGLKPAAKGFLGDGLRANAAEMNLPKRMFLSPKGLLYFADSVNNRIRVINTTSTIITTVAGNGTAGFTGDNKPATLTALNGPYSVWGNTVGLYIADSTNYRIRLVNVAGIMITIAGTGADSYNGENVPASSAPIKFVCDIVGDTIGTIYLVEGSNCRVRKIVNGIISTAFGTGSCSSPTNLPQIITALTSLVIGTVDGLFVDTRGTFYFTDRANFVRSLSLVSSPSSQPSSQPTSQPTEIVQSYYFSTIGGNGASSDSGDGFLAPVAGIKKPEYSWGDTQGNLYFAQQSGRVRMIASNRVISTVAGTGTTSNAGSNGLATSTNIEAVTGIVGDVNGTTIYFGGSFFVWKLQVSTSQLTRIAGLTVGNTGFAGDGGPATSARFAYIYGMFLTTTGVLFLADSNNARIRTINLVTKIVNTFAGNGSAKFCPNDIAATSSCLYTPYGVWMDSAGVAYIADTQNHRVRRVVNGIIKAFAGTGVTTFNGDYLSATFTNLNFPSDIKGDTLGHIYIVEYGGCRVRKVYRGMIYTIVGIGSCGITGSAAHVLATNAALQTAIASWIDSNGKIYLTEETGYVRLISMPDNPTSQPSNQPTSQPTAGPVQVYLMKTIAGTGNSGSCSDGSSAVVCPITTPYGIWSDAVGTVYFAERGNYKLRKVSTSGIMTTVSGSGGYSNSGAGGPALSVSYDGIYGVYGDTNGKLYHTGYESFIWVCIAGFVNHYGGKVPVATGYAGDGGPATAAVFSAPRGIYLSYNSGRLYLADSQNNRVRFIDPSGSVYLFAGSGNAASGGENVAATVAGIYTPMSVWGDSFGTIYIAEFDGHKIRKVSTGGIISTFAGTGTNTYNGDNMPITSVNLNGPADIKGDTIGNYYILEATGFRLRKVSPFGIIKTIVGTGVGVSASTFIQFASSAPINSGFGLWVDTMGSIYYTEVGFIRKVYSQLVVAPSSQPSSKPSRQPTCRPSSQPTSQPSSQPSRKPSGQPSTQPSGQPICRPSSRPTTQPSSQPSRQPTCRPSSLPTSQPSSHPSRKPTGQPSVQPSGQPMCRPSSRPTTQPSSQPSRQPTRRPSSLPTSQPSSHPSRKPSSLPSSQPSAQPSNRPLVQPRAQPSSQPSRKPTAQPSSQPSKQPSARPSRQPTSKPSSQPSLRPTMQPTVFIGGIYSGFKTSLLAYYPFDGNAFDKSGNGYNGKVLGGVSLTTDRFNNPRSAYQFDGISGYIEINGKDMNLGNSFTISFWINPSADAQSIYSVIIDKSYGGPNGGGYCFASQDTYSFTYVLNSGIVFSTNAIELTASVWSYVVIVKINNVLRIYVNSVQASASTSQIVLKGNGNFPLLFGAANSGLTSPATSVSSFFSGALDDIMILNRSVTAAEVSTLRSFDVISLLPTSQPSNQPSMQPTVRPSSRPTNLPSVDPFSQPTSPPSSKPSTLPSAIPTFYPSSMPSSQPSSCPSIRPSSQPSTQPSANPSSKPSSTPSSIPSVCPSTSPTDNPSCYPSSQPSLRLSTKSSSVPSSTPTLIPSSQPFSCPSLILTNAPSGQPTCCPSGTPSSQPSAAPSRQPSNRPTTSPSSSPSFQPISLPSARSSSLPTYQANTSPSFSPISHPSWRPTDLPTTQPSQSPTTQPSMKPSSQQSSQPFKQPTSRPSCSHTMTPSIKITTSPTTQPVPMRSFSPSFNPSSQSTAPPSTLPSGQPTSQPSSSPSSGPSKQPTAQPSTQPSAQPVIRPTFQPISQPTFQPSSPPTSQPSPKHSRKPTFVQTAIPTHNPTTLPTLRPTVLHTAVPTALLITASSNTTGWKEVLSFIGVYSSVSLADSFRKLEVMQPVSGFSYLLFGSKSLSVSRAVIDATVLAPRNPVSKISPSYRRDSSPRSALIPGDVNGDGFNDLLVCNPLFSRCFIFFGSKDGLTNVQVSVTIQGESSSDYFGFSCSSVGLMNQDTLSDIIVCALGKKRCYVIFGSAQWPNKLMMSQMSSSSGFKIVGDSDNTISLLGVSVAGMGDMNGDGMNDIAITAITTSAAAASNHVIYVVYGRKNNNDDVVLSEIDKSVGGFRIIGEVGYYSGFSISAIGDVNDDSFMDLAIGKLPFAENGFLQQQSTVIVFGRKNSSSDVFLSSRGGLEVLGAGFIVSGIGDVNKDGVSDVMMTACFDYKGKGNAYIVSYPSHITSLPTILPSSSPSGNPSSSPSSQPSTALPSTSPSPHPVTFAPSLFENRNITVAPAPPTISPSKRSSMPSRSPTTRPISVAPIRTPTMRPTTKPSFRPTTSPTRTNSKVPIRSPSRSPSRTPTISAPTSQPSSQPSLNGQTSATIIHITAQGDYIGTSQRQIFDITGDGKIRIKGGKGTNTYIIHPSTTTTTTTTSSPPASTTVSSLSSSQSLALVNATAVTIVNFDVTLDTIDLRYFPRLQNIEDISFSDNPLTLYPAKNCKVILPNVDKLQYNKLNIVFAVPSQSTAIASSDATTIAATLLDNPSTLISLIVIFVCVFCVWIVTLNSRDLRKDSKTQNEELEKEINPLPVIEEIESGSTREQEDPPPPTLENLIVNPERKSPVVSRQGEHSSRSSKDPDSSSGAYSSVATSAFSDLSFLEVHVSSHEMQSEEFEEFSTVIDIRSPASSENEQDNMNHSDGDDSSSIGERSNRLNEEGGDYSRSSDSSVESAESASSHSD